MAIIDAVREVLGGIDVDPASNESAQARVQASVYFTEENDGLAQPWRGRVWLNGPYSNLLPWAEKLSEELGAGRTTEAIALTNCDPSTRWWATFDRQSTALCLLRQRVAFLDATGAPVRGNNKAQAVFYIGRRPRRFREVFQAFGAILAWMQ